MNFSFSKSAVISISALFFLICLSIFSISIYSNNLSLHALKSSSAKENSIDLGNLYSSDFDLPKYDNLINAIKSSSSSSIQNKFAVNTPNNPLITNTNSTQIYLQGHNCNGFESTQFQPTFCRIVLKQNNLDVSVAQVYFQANNCAYSYMKLGNSNQNYQYLYESGCLEGNLRAIVSAFDKTTNKVATISNYYYDEKFGGDPTGEIIRRKNDPGCQNRDQNTAWDFSCFYFGDTQTIIRTTLTNAEKDLIQETKKNYFKYQDGATRYGFDKIKFN